MNRIFLLVALLLGAMPALGQSIEKIYVKNGSVYDGYISEQIPGKSISVYSESSLLCFKVSELSSVKNDNRMLSQLPENAREFLRKEGIKDDYVQVMSFVAHGERFDDTYVIGNDVKKQVKVACFTPRTFILKWGDLVKTVKTKPVDPAYGIKEIVTLVDGARYEGTVYEQVIGQKVLFVKQNGEKITLPMSDVLSIRSEKKNEKISFAEQTPLFDRLIMADGRIYDGFIQARVMNRKVKILNLSDSTVYDLPLAQIVKYQKYYNVKYKESKASTTDRKEVQAGLDFSDSEAAVQTAKSDVADYHMAHEGSICLNGKLVEPIKVSDILACLKEGEIIEHQFLFTTPLDFTIKEYELDKSIELYRLGEIGVTASRKIIMVNLDKKVELHETLKPIIRTSVSYDSERVGKFSFDLPETGVYVVVLRDNEVGLIINAIE